MSCLRSGFRGFGQWQPQPAAVSAAFIGGNNAPVCLRRPLLFRARWSPQLYLFLHPRDVSKCLNLWLRVQDLDVFLAGDDVPKKKPDPTIYRIAAERLGVSPEECIVIEDSVIGAQVSLLSHAWPALAGTCEMCAFSRHFV
jgi:hypothetical protein